MAKDDGIQQSQGECDSLSLVKAKIVDQCMRAQQLTMTAPGTTARAKNFRSFTSSLIFDEDLKRLDFGIFSRASDVGHRLPGLDRIIFGVVVSIGCLFPTTWARAQTPPVPWNGTRGQSCAQYHTAKYKTPIYSAEAINKHLVHSLAVDNTPKVFYCWEGPVRYYLEVPPDYPELTKLFEEQVVQVAKYTGLNIGRHDKPYLPYKNDTLNEKSKWPEGLSTNAMVVLTKDFKSSVQTPVIKQIVESMGGTVKQELAEWNYVKSKISAEDFHSRISYSYDPDKLVFMLQMMEPNFSTYASVRSKSNPLAQATFANAVSFATKLNKGSKYLPTVLTEGTHALTDFDKQFLRVLYGKHVHSGMLLIKAKRLMMEELIDCFNAKSDNAKR